MEPSDDLAKAKLLPTVCAVLGSMRLKVSRDMMKRLAVEENFTAESLDYFARIFDHIGHIEHLRDTLAHQKLSQTGDPHTWQLSDYTTTRNVRSKKVYEITSDAVNMASDDLIAATDYLDLFLEKGRDPSSLQQPAWRYKPSMLKLLPKKKGPSLQSRQRPPRSSRE
jgi:hypothetical protein